MERISNADDALNERIEALRQTLAQLTPDVKKLQGEQKTTWTWIKGGAGFIAFDVIITVAGLIFGIYLHHVEEDNHKLLSQVQDNQARLNTSVHETCNLYGTFESFYSDAAKARFVSGPQAYDNLYRQLQVSGDNLQCGIKHVVPGT